MYQTVKISIGKYWYVYMLYFSPNTCTICILAQIRAGIRTNTYKYIQILILTGTKPISVIACIEPQFIHIHTHTDQYKLNTYAIHTQYKPMILTGFVPISIQYLYSSGRICTYINVWCTFLGWNTQCIRVNACQSLFYSLIHAILT